MNRFRYVGSLALLALLSAILGGCAASSNNESNSSSADPITDADKAVCKDLSEMYLIVYDFMADGMEQDQLKMFMVSSIEERYADDKAINKARAVTLNIINEVYENPETARNEWYTGVYGRCLLDK